jgi:hypothetical protein
MSPTDDWSLTLMSPTPQSGPKGRAELRTADGEMMVVHVRGNCAAISRCFWSGSLVAREQLYFAIISETYLVVGGSGRTYWGGKPLGVGALAASLSLGSSAICVAKKLTDTGTTLRHYRLRSRAG